MARGPSTWDGKREFADLPKPYDRDGNELSRNKSCHVCTQGLASWKGHFSRPLACITCPRNYCSRCLFHINNVLTLEDAEAFIAAHQGAWSCFHCTGDCACQNPRFHRAGRPPIEAHKAAGWAGVTGGGVAARRPPPIKRGTRQKASPVPTPVPESPVDAGTPSALAPPLPLPPSPPSPPAQASGAALVGRACEAFWEAEQQWFRGTIAVWSSRSKRHRIDYEDGDNEWVELPDESVRFV